VSIAIAEEHAALAAAVRRFLETRCPPQVARVGLDAEREEMPAFWGEFAALGWLGLHLPEADGGQGFGLLEAAVVAEELGRVGAPGPFLPTMVASALIALAAGAEARPTLLPALATGQAVAAVAFPASGALAGSVPDADGAIVVSGTVRPVPAAALADWLLVRAECPDGDRWCVLEAAEVTVSELSSLDPTRRSASVTAEAVTVPAQRQLAGLDRRDAEAVAATLVASECAGGAGWCVDTAAAHAKVREQFGRPIGQFQAVKHRCADMLVAAEQVRAVAWDAAVAADQARRSGAPQELRLAASVAGAVASEAFLRVAKDCIQVLGGIGFTWEHDAHRYLRRATTLVRLMGGAASWRAELASIALQGGRRHLGIDLPEGSEAARQEVRAFCESVAGLDPTEQRARLVDSGYFVPHWASPWGRGAGPVEQLVIDDELRRAKLRRPTLAVGAWAAPTIASHGTVEQQERWVGPTLRGEITWCQLFSEPGAGSDLASLTTKAVATEGGWLLTGQKVWTSLATEADWGICLARTDPSAPKHLGITYFVVDMGAAGIDIRPLREMTGLSMFNEVFLSDVFVPDDCVIGEVNGGWSLARTTLANERVAMGSGASFGGGVETLLGLAAGLDLDALARDALGALLAEAQCVTLLGHRATHRAVAGGGHGAEASVRKLLSAEHDQRVQEFGLALLGGEGATTEGAAAQWSFGFLANRCLTIAGGTSEVQRNVIAERLLGLPRDPEPGG